MKTKCKYSAKELTNAELNGVVGGQGVLDPSVDVLKTIKEKVINASTDTNTDVDRQAIQKEIEQSIEQIDDNALLTFNGKFLNNGSR